MEKFIVSARKYRPQNFATVVGQEHITTTLKNAITSGHLAHAFLFCGPRGVGKTTCARILAKTINCENASQGEACNTCHSCVSFNEGTSLNIHELDAASNNSVDDIRSLVDQVRFAPQAGKYKVYIIDEVHMLSSSAFNAFLKTLEEPPPYAIFILATTEKHKILPTILSRCQIFDFKRITLQDTVDHLKEIADKESIKTEETALQLIAQKSEGCMRDALSILDKIVSFTNGAVSYDNTIEHLNILDADYYFRLMDCMLAQDLSGAMLLFDDINKKGFEGDMVLNGLAEFMRNLLICKDERVSSLLDVVESFRKRYAETARKTDAGYLVSALNILNESEINYRMARNKRLHVEMALIRLCYLSQALQLVAEGTLAGKKKLTEETRALAFRNIAPIGVPAKKTEKDLSKEGKAKLIIDTGKASADKENREEKVPPNQISKPVIANASEANPKPAVKTKLSSLDAIRKQIDLAAGGSQEADHPLQYDELTAAWKIFIEQLKKEKNSAWQSFELARLHILDASSFEAIVNNNIEKNFLMQERNKACSFLRKHLRNKFLQITIQITDQPQENLIRDLPLSSKEQYLKMAEQFPLVRELKDRLRLELDY